MHSRNISRYEHILKATKAIFFFGVGHQGLHGTKELEAMVMNLSDRENTARLKLVRQLNEISDFLPTLKEDLVEIWQGRKIFSFYETEFTPTVQKVRKTLKISIICLVYSRLFHLLGPESSYLGQSNATAATTGTRAPD